MSAQRSIAVSLYQKHIEHFGMAGLRFYRLKSCLVNSQVGGCFIPFILVQIRFRWRALVLMLPG